MSARISVLILLSLLLNACVATSLSESEPTQNQVAATYNAQLGLGYLGKGDTERAKRKLLTAVELAPDYPPVLDSMAYYQEMTGNDAQAEKWYKKSIDIAPHQGEGLNNYGAFLCRQGDYKASIDYFMKAVQDPSYVQVAGAYENAGLCAMKLPDEALAETYFIRAIEENPRSATALLELGDMNFKQAHYSQAESYLNAYNKYAAPSAQSVWLGYQLATKEGDTALAEQQAIMLAQYFPNSYQAKQLQVAKHS